MTEKITDFLDRHGILWEPINLYNKSPTKIGDFKPDPTDYNLDPSVLKERQKIQSVFIAIFTNQIAQVDIDAPGFKAKKLENGPYYTSITKKLPHYFVKVTGTTNKRSEILGGDLLTGQWAYCLRDTLVYNSDKSISQFSIHDFEKRVSFQEFKRTVKKLKENIDFYSYSDWIRICYGIYNTAHENIYKDPYWFVHDFSSSGSKYDDKAKQIIDSIQYDPEGVKYPTLLSSIKKDSQKNTENADNAMDYSEWKELWEQHVFSVKIRNTVCHDLYKDVVGIVQQSYGSTAYFINDNNFLSLAIAKCSDNYKETCVRRWNVDPSKREYMDFEFSPYPYSNGTNYEYYNTWNDFKFVNYVSTKELNVDHCIKVYQDFKMHLAKHDQVVYDYLLQIDAHLAQFPGEKIGVAIVINGNSGTGKGTESLLKESIFGKEYVYQTSDISQVLGQFTSSISRKLVIILDEAVPKNMFEKDGPLKHLITEPNVKIEKKGHDSYLENSFCRVIITSNNDNVVKISNSDRRMFVICPDIYDPEQYDEYPNNIFQLARDPDACKIVFDYLRSVPVKYRDIAAWQINRPITREYEEIRENCIPTFIRFLIQFVRDYEPEKFVFTIRQHELYEHFKAYTSDNSKFGLPFMTFCHKVKKLQSIETMKTKSGKTTVVFYKIQKTAFENEITRLNYTVSD